LNARRLRVRHADMDVFPREQLPNFPAAASGKGDHSHLALVRRCESAHHVFRIAAGGNAEKDIARLTEGANLLGEHLFVFVVVRDRRQGDVSVVSAIAASPGRSRSKRLSSSAEKCCASAAEPPFPHARILPLARSVFNHDLRGVSDGLGEHLVRLQLELRAIVELARMRASRSTLSSIGRGVEGFM